MVGPVVVKVKVLVPLVTKLPASVIVLPVLSTPVPPFDPGKIPDTSVAEILPIARVTYCVVATVKSFELTTGVGAVGVPVNAGDAIVALNAMSAMF